MDLKVLRETSRSRLLAALALFVLAVGSSMLLSRPAEAASKFSPHPPLLLFAAGDPLANCKNSFLGLIPWYNYMDKEFVPDVDAKGKPNPNNNCGYRIGCFNVFTLPKDKPNDCNQYKSDIPGILLAVIDDLLRIAGLVAIGFVFIGAFQYVRSRGNSERTVQAQTTIVNALIGLAVALVAVAFIAFLGARLGGT